MDLRIDLSPTRIEISTGQRQHRRIAVSPRPPAIWLIAALATSLCLAGFATADSAAAAPAKQSARVKLPRAALVLDARNRVRVPLRCTKRPCAGRLRLRSTQVRKGERRGYGSKAFKLKRKRGAVRVRASKRLSRQVRQRGSARALLLAKARGQRRPAHRVVTIRARAGSTPSPSPSPSGPHRILAAGDRLYDSVTGATFVPRGANFVRLRTTPAGTVYHSTFEPGYYDAAAARAALDGMRASGYNAVRVFIDPGSTIAAEAHGIGRGIGTSELVHGPYMDNVANFVTMAAERGIYVTPVLDQFPQNDYYWGIVARTIAGVGTPNMAGRNLTYLDKGRVAAKEEYMRQFAGALIARVGVNATAVLAYQPDNELFFEASQAPYDKMSGTVKPLNGVTYDMSVPAQRQQSADASLAEYSRRLDRALAQADPQALLTIGFFTNRAVGKTGFDGFAKYCSTSCTPGVDYRVPGRPAALSMSGAVDFLDVHVYASAQHTSTVDLESVEYGQFRRPWIVGEFGTQKSLYGNDVAKAANGMRGYQASTCKLGAQGWLYWTWDTHENLASQQLFFHLDDGGGAINAKLATISRPNPCA